ncbi:MmgE/PrpD family protein [Dactylosporangium sp. NPDC050688]|uniref:MmgE/PrpD family protein n=1 Tax=Dactylosporangium sp. NPDC050688 TaxID=3157217 RepID=UPI0033E7F76C
MIASQVATLAVRLSTEGLGEEARAAATAALEACQPRDGTACGGDAVVDAAIRDAAFGADAGSADPLTRALRYAADAPCDARWQWRVVAAALAGQPGGDRAAEAALIGAEVAHRLAMALDGPVSSAWDAPGRVGVIGAAVAAGLAGGADAGQLASAVAISASLTSGHQVHAGTPLGRLHPGFAAAAGVLAASLGRRGVTGSPTAVEGPRGLFHAYGERDAAAGLLDGFGTTWHVLDSRPATAAWERPAEPADRDGEDDLTDQLAHFASALRLDDLPEPVRHAGRRTLANVVGLAVDAAGHPAVELVAATLRDLDLYGTTAVLGRAEPVSPYAAALLMGYAMHVEDFDDTHLRTVLHPGAPAVAAALAAAQVAAAPGVDVLAGVVAGVEVGSRHPVIDAAIAVRAAGLVAADIERVVATVRPVVLEVMGVAEPRDGLQSKFSVYHCFAVGLLDGGAGPAQYSDARATDAAVVDLRRKVEVLTDPQMPKDACRVEVVDRKGVRHLFVVEHATGSVAAPMTDAQLADKFRLLAGPVLGERAEDLWRAVMALDEAERIADLFALAVRP